MNYVYVASKSPSKKIYIKTEEAIANLIGGSLYSLIGGVSQKNFGYDTIGNVAKDIRDYRSKYITPNNRSLFIDSSGYSFIKGDIHPDDVLKLIDCYHQYQEGEKDNYEIIFSLDIPLSLKHAFFNTIKNVKKYNKISLERSKAILLKYPEISKKFNFIWHFKTIEHFGIFNDLYRELSLKDVVINRSVGGMVGIRNIVKSLNFSPFTALAFRCLLDFETAETFDHTFRIHFLGINVKYDRFQIALLEKLFERYLADKTDIQLTYDSINYVRTAQLGVKSLDIYNFDGQQLDVYENILKLPKDSPLYNVAKQVYGDELYQFIREEMDKLRNGKKLINSNSFAPLNIHSNVSLDNYFSHIIDKYELVDHMFNCRSVTRYRRHVDSALNDLAKEHPILFTKPFIKSVLENINHIFRFHLWYINKRDHDGLNSLIVDFINEINFPRILH